MNNGEETFSWKDKPSYKNMENLNCKLQFVISAIQGVSMQGEQRTQYSNIIQIINNIRITRYLY